MESTAFEIHASRPSRHRKAWGRTRRQGFWPAGTARSGLQTTARSTASPTAASRPFARALVFRVTKSLPCSKTAPATCGWEWMTRSMCSRTGASDRIAGPDHQTAWTGGGNHRGHRWEYLGGVCRESAKARAHPRFRGARRIPDVASSGGPHPRAGPTGRNLDSNHERGTLRAFAMALSRSSR